MNGAGEHSKTDGFFTALLTSYRGVLTMLLIFAGGMIFSSKLNTVIQASAVSLTNRADIDAMQIEHIAFNQRFKSLEDRIMEQREMLLDLVCSNPDTAVNRRECRTR